MKPRSPLAWVIVTAIGATTAAVTIRLQPSGSRLVAMPDFLSLGRKVAGERVTAEFTLANDGPDRLSILGQSANCACTQVLGVPESLGPGEKARVSLLIDTSGRSGPLHATVQLAHDGRNGPFLALTANLDIVRGVLVDPPNWRIGTLEVGGVPGGKPAAIISVTSEAGLDLESLKLVGFTELVRYSDVERASGKRILRLVLEPPFPVGRFSFPVHFDVAESRHTMLVGGQGNGRVEVDRSHLTFNTARSEARSRDLVVSAKDGELVGCELERLPRGFEGRVEERSPDRVRVRIRATNPVSRHGNDKLILRVSSRSATGGTTDVVRCLVDVMWHALSPYEDYVAD